ncbi:MAG: hypothetical protein ACJAT2_001553 [Bacteriovoracaceae bacterium]|jgi:hypothetical protein
MQAPSKYEGVFISRMECMSAKAGAESGRFPGWNVCPRRQEPRAGDFQDGMYVREGKARAGDFQDGMYVREGKARADVVLKEATLLLGYCLKLIPKINLKAQITDKSYV